jgi:hypothetical protein
MRYSIPGKPDTVHNLLIQKSTHVFDLVVWGEQVYGANDVEVDLGASRARVAIYDVVAGTAPIQRMTNVRSVPLTLSDHAMVIEVTP